MKATDVINTIITEPRKVNQQFGDIKPGQMFRVETFTDPTNIYMKAEKKQAIYLRTGVLYEFSDSRSVEIVTEVTIRA